MAVPPDPVAASTALHRSADELAHRLADATAAWGRRVEIDGPAVLTERARLRGLEPGGRRSHGGATRLLPSADGWAAVALSRPSDVDLLPAWREVLRLDAGLSVAASGEYDTVGGFVPDDAWVDVADLVASSSGADLAVTAELLGLAVGVLGERRPDQTGGVVVTSFGPAPERADGRLWVLDLSSLWAGPLCAHLLGLAGAEVTKVEATDRRDGARFGDPDLYEQLNASKRTVVLDLRSDLGRADLAELVGVFDVVVTASRRRALDALGLDPATWLQREGGPAVWVSITGHGLASSRIAFGDDAAVAGGLVGHDDDGPIFLGDAVADPLSGLLAAARAAEAVATGHRTLLDVSMATTAATVAAAG